MRALLVIPAAVVSFALTILSLPWFVWSIGLYALGEEVAAERIMECAPLCLFFDYVEGVRR